MALPEAAGRIQPPGPIRVNKVPRPKRASTWSLEIQAGPTGPPPFMADVRLEKSLGERLSVSAGLQYTQGRLPGVSYDSALTATRWTIWYNHLDVPLLGSWNAVNGRHFTAGLETGAVFNVYSWYEGYRGPNIPNVYSYRRNSGVSLDFGIPVAVRIGPRWFITLQPYEQIPLFNTIRSGQGYQRMTAQNDIRTSGKTRFPSGRSTPTPRALPTWKPSGRPSATRGW